MEALKRRMALLEADPPADVAPRWRAESREEDHRRVEDLSRRVGSAEKRCAALQAEVQDLGDQLQESAHLTSRLGHDLTRALEGLVESGNTLARVQTATEARFAELSAKIATADPARMAPAAAMEAALLPFSTNLEAFLAHWQSRVGEELFSQQKALTSRLDALDGLIRRGGEAGGRTGPATVAAPDTSNVGGEMEKRGKTPDGYALALESITREIQSLWKALQTLRLPDLELSGSAMTSPHHAEAPPCWSIATLPHPIQDHSEIEKVVETCVQANLLNLSSKFGADLRESIETQCDLISQTHAARVRDLESTVERVHRALVCLKDRVDIKASEDVASANDHQGRLGTVESALTDLSRDHQQLAKDLYSLREILLSFQNELEEGRRKSPKATPPQLDDRTARDLTHLGVDTPQLEGDVQPLVLTGLPVLPSSSSSVTTEEAYSQKEEVLLELLGREATLLEERLNAAFCTKVLLEDRLEALQKSLVNLVASKVDREAMNAKVGELHQLITEEVNIQFRELRNDVMNNIAEKVSLNELQEILERDICEFT
ncbi:unnamed protein product [Phytomonas sp. Hart1]|nr:unnamed protein product [Phytomonas sp. Hart1]|eukprot:CCW70735.1 unnamed protein product [Phytomonas sp. isolate Hart1]